MLTNSAPVLMTPSHYLGGGRGYPDISALAHNFFIRFQNKTVAKDGTSASSPVIAGIVGLINAHRKRNNRPAVGLFNPLLYQIYDETNGTAFHDIWVGNNACTESGCTCKSGFPAVRGWDAVSGLGTPNLGRMLDAIDAIDARREANGNHRHWKPTQTPMPEPAIKPKPKTKLPRPRETVVAEQRGSQVSVAPEYVHFS